MRLKHTKQDKIDQLNNRHVAEIQEHAGKLDSYADYNDWYNAEQIIITRQNKEYKDLIESQ